MKLNLVLGLLFSFNLSAATYYIDFAGGLDSNSGTSKTAPWKRHPWMRGSAVAGYSHQIGDRFIFKGGVRWPNAALPLVIHAGGASGAFPGSPLMGYHGVDKTWFTGGSYSPPVFDSEDAEIPTHNVCVMGIGKSNWQIDGILFYRMFWEGLAAYNDDVCVNVYDGTNVVISNCIFTNWSHAPFGANTKATYYMVQGNTSPPHNHGSYITNCVFDNGGRESNPGAAGCQYFPNVYNSKAHRIASAFITSANSHVYGCVIGPNIPPGEGSHENQLEITAGGLHRYHDNIITNGGTVVVFMGGYGPGNTNIFYNNVIYRVNAPLYNETIPIAIDNSALNPGGSAYIWNNTFVTTNVNCIRLVDRDEGAVCFFNAIFIQNNLFITDSGGVQRDSPGPSFVPIPIQNYINNFNITMSVSQAAAAGYTYANRFQPTDASDVSVNAGTPLSFFSHDILGVSRGETWDVGAYEFAGVIAVQPPRNLRRITDP